MNTRTIDNNQTPTDMLMMTYGEMEAYLEFHHINSRQSLRADNLDIPMGLVAGMSLSYDPSSLLYDVNVAKVYVQQEFVVGSHTEDLIGDQ